MATFNKAISDVWSAHGGFFPKIFSCPGCGKNGYNSEEFYDWPERKRWYCEACQAGGWYWTIIQWNYRETRISVEYPSSEVHPSGVVIEQPIAMPPEYPESILTTKDASAD